MQGPDNITVAIGTEVSMHCSVLGFPVPMVHWFKDACLPMNSSASFSLQDNGQLLTFRSSTAQHNRNINSLLFQSNCGEQFLTRSKICSFLLFNCTIIVITVTGHKGGYREQRKTGYVTGKEKYTS